MSNSTMAPTGADLQHVSEPEARHFPNAKVWGQILRRTQIPEMRGSEKR